MFVNNFVLITLEWGVFNLGKDVAPGRHGMPWRPVADPLHKNLNCNPSHQNKAAIPDRFNGVLV